MALFSACENFSKIASKHEIASSVYNGCITRFHSSPRTLCHGVGLCRQDKEKINNRLMQRHSIPYLFVILGNASIHRSTCVRNILASQRTLWECIPPPMPRDVTPWTLVVWNISDPGFDYGFPVWSGSECPPDRSQNVTGSFRCRRPEKRPVTAYTKCQ